MTATKFHADYDELAQIAQRFGREAEAAQRMVDAMRSAMQTLEAGDWQGQGARAFYAEMNSAVLPSLNRMVKALASAQRVTVQVSREVKAGEDAAATVLKGSGIGAAAGLAGAAGIMAGGGGGGGGSAGGGSSVSPSTGSSFIDSVVQSFKVKAKFPAGEPGKFGVTLFDGSVWGDKFLNGHGKWDVAGGAAGVGLQQINGKWMAGAVAEVYGARGKIEGALVGDKNLGWTAGVQAKALSAEGFIGYRDGSVGGKVGVNLASVEGETGINVAGANVGVSGGIGLKLELGLELGKKSRVHFGPFTLGFSFGGAKE